MTRPDRFDTPGVAPEWRTRMEVEFAKVLGDIPKPINPEPEPQK